MSIHAERRLYQPTELPALLKLSDEQIAWLVSTGQLNQIRIAGEIRYDSREIDALINTYLQVARRKKTYVQ